jgi:hypothetical protein
LLPVLKKARNDVKQQRQGALLDVDVEDGQQQLRQFVHVSLKVEKHFLFSLLPIVPESIAPSRE